MLLPGRDWERDVAEFEEMGEAELQLRMASGTWFGDRSLAEAWLTALKTDRRRKPAQQNMPPLIC